MNRSAISRGQLDFPLTITKRAIGDYAVTCPHLKGHTWTGKDEFEARQNAKTGIHQLNAELQFDTRADWQKSSEWVENAAPEGKEERPKWMAEPFMVSANSLVQ